MVSAGIIPYRIINNKIEFFVGHPGGPYWKNNPYYAFLKGGVEEGENSLNAAIREFKEESNIDIPKDLTLIFLGSVRQNSKKTVYAYAGKFDINPNECFSNKCEVEFPSKSGNMIEVPEIDRYAWVEYDELKKITNDSHLLFYESIIEYENNQK